jgi:hypothetical protein
MPSRASSSASIDRSLLRSYEIHAQPFYRQVTPTELTYALVTAKRLSNKTIDDDRRFSYPVKVSLSFKHRPNAGRNIGSSTSARAGNKTNRVCRNESHRIGESW